MPEDDRWLTSDEVAELLQITAKTVRRMAIRGDLPSYRIAGSRLIRFKKEEVEACLIRTT